MNTQRQMQIPQATQPWFRRVPWIDVGGLSRAYLKIDPELASEMLLSMAPNRGVRWRVVNNYGHALKHGLWARNGFSLVFDGDGRLIDGQHRLLAIVRFGLTCYLDVVFGVDPDCMNSIDTNIIRTTTDAFRIAGVSAPTVLGAAIRTHLHYLSYVNGTGARPTLLPVDAFEHLKEHPELSDVCNEFQSNKTLMRLFGSAGAVANYLFRKIKAIDAELFFARMADGAGLACNSPILTLRDQLSRMRTGGRSTKIKTPIEVLELTITAWNAYRKGREMKQIRPLDLTKSDFPVPI